MDTLSKFYCYIYIFTWFRHFAAVINIQMDRFRSVSVEEELTRNPGLSRQDIEEILRWIETLPHLPKITAGEALMFIHSSDYDLDESKRKILEYFQCRTQYKEFFSNLNLKDKALAQVGNSLTMVSLPKRTPDGYKVILTKLWSTDPSRYDAASTCKMFSLFLDGIHLREGTQKGFIYVMDTDGAGLGHILRLNLFALKKYFHYFQEAEPIRIAKVHIVNTSPLVRKLRAMFRPFVKDEKYVKHHNSFDSVYEYVPAEIFPMDYPGGKEPALSGTHDKYYKDLIELQEYFTIEEKTRRLEKSALN